MAANSHERFTEKFITDDVLSDKKDKTHPFPYVQGKDIGSFYYKRLRYLEWGTRRAPALFRAKTFPELQNAPEKILTMRRPGKGNAKLFYDTNQIHFDASSVGFVFWHILAGVENQSIIKSARYCHQKPRKGEKTREELEKISNRFSPLYLCGIITSTTAREFLAANRRGNIDLYPNDWKKLPIPDISAEEQKPIIQLVRQIIATKSDCRK